jgi:predicted nucleic acid-binding Zn ribbon protein
MLRTTGEEERDYPCGGTPPSAQQCSEQQGKKKERRVRTTRSLHFLFSRILFFVLGFSPFSIWLF